MELNAQSIAQLDTKLATCKPFGDSGYIRAQREARQRQWLTRIAADLPSAAGLLTALDNAAARPRSWVLGDPVLSHAIKNAVTRVVSGGGDGMPADECTAVLRQAADHAAGGAQFGLVQPETDRAYRLGSAEHHGWVWWDRDGRPLDGTFRAIVGEYYTSPVDAVDDTRLANIQRGVQLLDDLLPGVSSSALSHVRAVAVLRPQDTGKVLYSSSAFQISGGVFLGREVLNDPWSVAEYLLHESLHQKLYDFRHGHSLLASDSAPTREEAQQLQRAFVVSPWNSPGAGGANHWPTFRAISAFHVYAHLAVLSAAAELRAPELEADYGPFRSATPGMTPARLAFVRAHYLGESIRRHCWSELGKAGRLLVEWLISIIRALDAAPPPPGCDLHLLLDRYLSEARRLAELRIPAELDDQLPQLLDDEIVTARQVLASTGHRERLERFDDALTSLPENTNQARFHAVRTMISDLLTSVSPDGYSLGPGSTTSPGPDEIVRSMVDTSSCKLVAAGAGQAPPE